MRVREPGEDLATSSLLLNSAHAGYQRKSLLSSSLTERGLTYEDYDGTKEEPKKPKKNQITFQTGVHNLFPNFCNIKMS